MMMRTTAVMAVLLLTLGGCRAPAPPPAPPRVRVRAEVEAAPPQQTKPTVRKDVTDAAAKPIVGEQAQKLAELKREIEAANDTNGVDVAMNRLLVAEIYFRHFVFSKAVSLLETVVRAHMQHDVGKYAAALLLDALLVTSNLDKLRTWFALLRHNGALPARHQELNVTIANLSFGQAQREAESLAKAGQFKQCGDRYIAAYRMLADDSEQWDFVPTILLKASACYEKADLLGQSIFWRGIVRRRYPCVTLPGRPLLFRARRAVAVRQYARGAEYLEKFVRLHPMHKGAPLALFDAIAYRAAAGQRELVVANSELFVLRFARTHPDQAAIVTFALAHSHEHASARIETWRRYLRQHASHGQPAWTEQAHARLGLELWRQSCAKHTAGLCLSRRNRKLAKQAERHLRKAIAPRLPAGTRPDQRGWPEHNYFAFPDFDEALAAVRLALVDNRYERFRNKPVATWSANVKLLYTEVAAHATPAVRVAVLTRLGQIEKQLGQQKQSVEQFAACLATASEHTIDNEFSALCDIEVGASRPDLASPQEQRAPPSLDRRPTQLPDLPPATG